MRRSSPPRGRCVSPLGVTQRPSGRAGEAPSEAEDLDQRWRDEMSTWYPKEETENERRANAETLQRKIDIAQLHNRAANLGFTPGS